MLRQCFLKRIRAEIHVHCGGKPPGKHLAAIPIHDGHELQKSFAHGDIGDVRAPYLIRSAYFLVPQEVGIFSVCRMWLCRLGMLVYGHQMHQTHQASDTFPAC